MRSQDRKIDVLRCFSPAARTALTAGVALLLVVAVARLPGEYWPGLREPPTAGDAALVKPTSERPVPSREPVDSASTPRDAAGGHDWPGLFGPELSSFSRESSLDWRWPADGPPLAWRTDIGAGYSAPVAVDGAVVIFDRADDQMRLSSWDLETGDRRWRHVYPATFRCRVAYSDGPYSTPLASGDSLFTLGSEGRLTCLRRRTGQLVWERDLTAEFAVPPGLLGYGPGLAVDERRLYVNVGGAQRQAGVVAFDRETGEPVWQATDHKASYATPRLATIHGRRFLFVLTETGLVSLDPDTGREQWTHPFHSRVAETVNAVSPLVFDDRILLVAGPGPGAVCLRILEDGSPEIVWQDRRVIDSGFNNLLLHDDHVYGFSSRRQGEPTFRCVDLAKGELRWRYESDLGRGQSLGADGHVIVLGEEGHLAALELRPDRLAPVWVSPSPILAAPCFSAPALHRGRLVVRNERTLICFDLRTR